MNRLLVRNRTALWVSLLALVLCFLAWCGFARPSLTITSPKSGVIVHPGEFIRVKVRATPYLRFRLVMIAGSPAVECGGAELWPPFHFTVKVSDKAGPGAVNIVAEGTTGPGGLHSSEPVTLFIDVKVAPKSLKIEPDSVFARVGETVHLRVIAMFMPFGNRDLDGFPGVSFASKDPGIASVSEDGTIRGHGAGSTLVTVKYKGTKAEIPVEVR